MTDVSDTLKNRNNTHGDYHEQAELFAALWRTAQTGPKFRALTDQQMGGLLMVLHKASRVLCGNPNEPDHWHDIAGYATLVERDILAHRKEKTDGTDNIKPAKCVPEPESRIWRPGNFATE